MKEYWINFKKIWHSCWAFYLLPMKSIWNGYRKKPQNMTLIQHMAYPFKTYFYALKVWSKNEPTNT